MIKQLHPYLLILLPIICSAQNVKEPITQLLHELVKTEGVDQALKTYEVLKAQEADKYDFSFAQLNNLGYQLIAEKREEAAVKIFQANLKAFPHMISPYYSYGHGLLKTGANEAAIAAYTTGLKITDTLQSLTEAQRNHYNSLGSMQIRIASNFNRSTSPDLSYVANHGGGPAGNWDAGMLLDFQTERGNPTINYEANNFYNAPVPDFILDKFEQEPRPDVVSGIVKGVYRAHVSNGDIVNLSVVWDQNNWDSAFPPAIKRAVSYEGSPYFVPMSFQWNPIWYRKDIFEKVGVRPPSTWDELLELCRKLHKAGYLPFTVSGDGWEPPVARWFAILSLRLYGPDFYEDLMAGKISWLDERVGNVFVHWKTLFDNHAFSSKSAEQDWQFAVKDLAEGKAVMWNIGEWLWEFGPIQEQKGNIGFFAMPPITQNIPQVEILHLYGAHALSTKNQKLAHEFLTYLGSEEVQRSNHKTLQYRIPAHIKAADQLSTLQREQYDYIKKVDQLVPLFEMNTHPKIANEALRAFVDFWKNPERIKETMVRIESKRKEVYPSKN